MEDSKNPQRYLGGWRHKITGTVYLNAASQTGPSAKGNLSYLCSRSVQCIATRDASDQTSRTVATQMWRSDYYVSNQQDKHISVGYYESFDDLQNAIDYNAKAKIIQKCYRGWKMLKNIKECTEAYRKIVSDCKKFEEERNELHSKRHKVEIIRQLYPKNRSDFDKIYSLIESWKNFQVHFIKGNLFEASRKAEYYQVLRKTVEMLKTAEKQRKSIFDKFQVKKLGEFLNDHCKPVKWTGYKGKPVEMMTLKVQKAREYKALHDNLCTSHITPEERMENLILLKRTIELHFCMTSRDLEELIDREILLSSRGIEGASFQGLRKRISLLFLQLIRDSHSCCIKEERLMDHNFMEAQPNEKIICRSCGRLLPLNYFAAHVRMNKLFRCLGCDWLRQHSVEKVDYDPYTYLLNGIRADEHRRNCFSTLLYVIQEPGIYHLVCNIWHGRSIVSEVDDIFRLRLVRFYVKTEWAPWNCILLTEEESEAHYFIDDLTKVYSKVILDRINLAHEIAKTHFHDLIRFESKFRKSEHHRLIQQTLKPQVSKAVH